MHTYAFMLNTDDAPTVYVNAHDSKQAADVFYAAILRPLGYGIARNYRDGEIELVQAGYTQWIVQEVR